MIIYLPTYVVLARSRPFAAWHRRKRPLIAELVRSLVRSFARSLRQGNPTRQLYVGFCAARCSFDPAAWLAAFRTVRPLSVSKTLLDLSEISPRPSIPEIDPRIDRASKTRLFRTFARTSDYFDSCQ